MFEDAVLAPADTVIVDVDTRDARPPRRNPHAARLRAAGLRVTSARIATLHAAPEVLARHGHLTPALLRDACIRLGYAVNLSAFYPLLPDLAAAGLIPVSAIRLPRSRTARLEGLRIPPLDGSPSTRA